MPGIKARKLWPTPNASDSKDANPKIHEAVERAAAEGENKQVGLREAVKLWPTPQTTSSHGAGDHGEGGRNLQTAVLMPTPDARAWRSGKGRKPRKGHRPQLESYVQGQLNPTWVCWLMGYPLTWLDDVPGPKSRRASRASRQASPTG